MIDLEKEGFVGVRLSTGDLRGYFFYLTYANRAKTYSSIEAKKNNFDHKNNNLNTFYRYQDFRNNQMTKKDVNAIELVMSFSTEANHILGIYKGIENWEKEQHSFVVNLLEQELKNSTGFLLFEHKLDSSGYRLHYHILQMPYDKTDKKILGEEINYSKRYLQKDILEKIKDKYRAFINQELEKIDTNKLAIINDLLSKYKKPRVANIENFKSNIKYFEKEDLRLKESLEIESLKSKIKSKNINSESIIDLLLLTRYSKELFDNLLINYSLTEISDLVLNSKSKSNIVYLFLDLLIFSLQESFINEEEFFVELTKLRKEIKGEAKIIIEDRLSEVFNNKDLFKNDIKILENNFLKKQKTLEEHNELESVLIEDKYKYIEDIKENQQNINKEKTD